MRKLVLIMVLCIFLLGCKQDEQSVEQKEPPVSIDTGVVYGEGFLLPAIDIHGIKVYGRVGAYGVIVNTYDDEDKVRVYTRNIKYGYCDDSAYNTISLEYRGKLRIFLSEVDLIIKNYDTNKILGFIHVGKSSYWYEESEQR